MKTIKGQFEVKSSALPMDQATVAVGAMRMMFSKTFQGGIEATSTVSMMGIMDQALGSGGYVALEKLTGKLDGVEGSFCLQHSSTMSRGAPAQMILVIPDSGTGGLKDLTGEMQIDIIDGQHFYTFNYEL